MNSTVGSYRHNILSVSDHDQENGHEYGLHKRELPKVDKTLTCCEGGHCQKEEEAPSRKHPAVIAEGGLVVDQ